MNVRNSDSGTDVSSYSSWTVIEEIHENFIPNKDKDLESNHKADIEVIETTEVITISDANDKNNNYVEVKFSKESTKQPSDDESYSSKSESRDDSYHTFVGHLQEWMVEHDYVYPIQSKIRKKLNKPKSRTKNRSKCKAETIGLLSLCISLFTVTGIALLCVIFPENIDPKHLETIKCNCQATAENLRLDNSHIVGSINTTMEGLHSAKISKVLIESFDTFDSNPDYRQQTSNRAIGPINKIGSSRYYSRKQPKPNISTSNFSKNITSLNSNNLVCYRNEDPKLFSWISKRQRNKLENLKHPNQRSNSTMIKTVLPTNDNGTNALCSVESVLSSPKLKNIIRSIIHDICILKLITYLNKNVGSQKKNKKSNKGEQKASKRALSEEITDGLNIIHNDNIKERKTKTARRKNNTRNQFPIQQCRSSKNSIRAISDCIDKTPEKNFVQQYSRQSTRNPKTELLSKFENGKSECERRFEELDNNRKRSKDVCSKHKDNIQQIKQHYRYEMDAIKHSNIEPLIRLHRMQMLREKYKFKLKKYREVYTREISKMKRLRKKMLKDLRTEKRIVSEMKDVAVGSYVVPIEQDFHGQLQQKKDIDLAANTFVDLNVQNPNMYDGAESAFHTPKASPFYFSFPRSTDEGLTTEGTNGVCITKKQCEKLETRLPSGFELQPCLTMLPTNNFLELSSINKKRFYSEKKENDVNKNSDDSQGVDCAIDKNKLQGHLYQLAFEKKGKMIEKYDNIKWHHKRTELLEKYKKHMSKQDPNKCYRPNIIVKKIGLLRK